MTLVKPITLGLFALILQIHGRTDGQSDLHQYRVLYSSVMRVKQRANYYEKSYLVLCANIEAEVTIERALMFFGGRPSGTAASPRGRKSLTACLRHPGGRLRTRVDAHAVPHQRPRVAGVNGDTKTGCRWVTWIYHERVCSRRRRIVDEHDDVDTANRLQNTDCSVEWTTTTYNLSTVISLALPFDTHCCHTVQLQSILCQTGLSLHL